MAMASALLPWFPRFVFTVFEPISLIAGFIGVVLDTAWFVAEQIPADPLLNDAIQAQVGEHAVIVARQLGNLYLLMSFIGLAIFNTTSEPKVIKAYLAALALGDVGHLAFSFQGLGPELSLDVRRWNSMAVGNVAVTAFLLATRLAYFAGVFDQGHQLRTPSDLKKAKLR